MLGAGASKHCGFPLGVDLKDIILVTIEKILSDENLLNVFDEVGYDKQFIEEFKDGFEWNPELQTIDSYLKQMDNTERNEFASYVIGLSLSKYQLKREIMQKPGWYENFFSMLIEPDVEITNLSVVTFNYDQSLEYYLDTKIRTIAPEKKQPEYKDKINRLEILHPHGKLTENDPIDNPITVDNILDLSQKIKTISDDFSNNLIYEKARTIVNDSDEVLFMGFGYHLDIFNSFFKDIDLASKNVLGTSVGVSRQDALNVRHKFGQSIYEVIPTGLNLDCQSMMSTIRSRPLASIDKLRLDLKFQSKRTA